MWRKSGLWQDAVEIPASVAATLSAADGFEETAALLAADRVRRVVATGNGAAYYVALALWLASLEGRAGPEVIAVPSGLVAGGRFAWRPGDMLLAVSSSGEFRDLVEAIPTAPSPFAAITATPGSTIGAAAGARAAVTVLNQRAVTHTQAFCGAVVAALAVWAEVTGDRALRAAVETLPETMRDEIVEAEGWANELDVPEPKCAVAFGGGPGWAAALEAALLLKEVAGVPAEGMETREGATTAMFSLARGHLVLSLSAGDDDPLLVEAEKVCAARGATVVRAARATHVDRRFAAITTHPAAVALSARIGAQRGLDLDRPAWTDAYYEVARSET
jgi:glucosamine--fructose-6-phosphate aminotransferase (isomerizing)